ncbi:hypothetical protein [Prochlorothrix hollandica]|uniref:hypothetical protein n=1 Tax=Prochlorothrix hollandica TaxID=1223 RepID=UPI000349C031|nr:hypothetical protein [Prochlorothrix hollandica]
MKLLQRMKDMLQFVSEGFISIFNKPKDHYPLTGVQPFDGEPHSRLAQSKSSDLG